MEIYLLFLLFTKHFIVDFPLQWEYQWKNKGTYGHPGGLIHAGLHGIGTYLCFFWISVPVAVVLAVFDMVVHYHIDWAKMNIARGLTVQDKKYWFWLGFDQLIHALTYLAIGISVSFLLTDFI